MTDLTQNPKLKTQNFPVLSTQHSALLFLRRHRAIDVPVACAAGFEKFFVIAFKLPGFHDVKGKYEGTEHDRQYFR